MVVVVTNSDAAQLACFAPLGGAINRPQKGRWGVSQININTNGNETGWHGGRTKTDMETGWHDGRTKTCMSISGRLENRNGN